MHKQHPFFFVYLFLGTLCLLLSGCSSLAHIAQAHPPVSQRTTLHQIFTPEASGEVVYNNGLFSVDASNTSEGYIMVCYHGSADKAKLQLTTPNKTVYTYTLFRGHPLEVFPLTGGNGSYHLDALEHVQDDLYALGFTLDLNVSLVDEFKPFLYPNQYIPFTAQTQAVRLGQELSEKSTDNVDYVDRVYQYVTKNIQYDEAKAAHTPVDYLPDLNQTLAEKKGICFDYAALMAAMLRSQGIPTKLEVGYSGTAYHAWVSVYLEDQGWVDKIFEFDGKSWVLMDPTLAANNGRNSVRDYIGDGRNYSVKYSY